MSTFDVMTTFDVIDLVLALTGAAMVVGGIWLIASGAVRLNAEKAGATNLRLGDFLSLSTTVPGLGLFVIGLAFEVVAISYANAKRVDLETTEKAVQADRKAHAVHLMGYFSSPDPSELITLSACIGESTIIHANEPFDNPIDLYSSFLHVTADRTGAKPLSWTLTRGLPSPHPAYENTIVLDHGTADVGKVDLQKPIVSLADIKKRDVSPPPLTDAGAAYVAGATQ